MSFALCRGCVRPLLFPPSPEPSVPSLEHRCGSTMTLSADLSARSISSTVFLTKRNLLEFGRAGFEFWTELSFVDTSTTSKDQIASHWELTTSIGDRTIPARTSADECECLARRCQHRSSPIVMSSSLCLSFHTHTHPHPHTHKRPQSFAPFLHRSLIFLTDFRNF